ncbi:uncharacterized protein AAGF69_000462 [Amazona ochrocephala]
MRAVSYDEPALKALLYGAKGKDLIPSVDAAFQIATWEKIGATLWEEIKAFGGYRLGGYGPGETQQKAFPLQQKMSVMIKNLLVVKLLILLFVYNSVSLLHEINPRKNLWVTWASESGVSEFCLAMASATDPFQTCLIGIPGYNENSFKAFSTNNCSKSKNVADCSAELISGLNRTLPWDPQELNLMASQAVGNSSQNWTQTCIMFGCKYAGCPYSVNSPDVSPKDSTYWYTNEYCGINDTAGKATAFKAYGSTHQPGSVPLLWNNSSAKALPPDVFLICGDRAWQGIPKDIVGGPCYLGSLTIFAPKFTELSNLSHILHSRSK